MLRLSCLLLGAVVLSLGWQEGNCKSIKDREVIIVSPLHRSTNTYF